MIEAAATARFCKVQAPHIEIEVTKMVTKMAKSPGGVRAEPAL